MPRSSFHVALVASALIASPRVLVGPANPAPLRPRSSRSARWSASPDGPESPTAPGLAGDDWRRFRARLLLREEALTEDVEDVAQGTMEKGWIHRSPLIEKGSVLLAKPGEWSVMFPFFHKSVILITDHEDEYTRGFVLNRPTIRSVSSGRLEFNVWYGGPCEGGSDASARLFDATAQRHFCLHSEPLPGSDLVAPGIYITEPWAASRSIMEGKAQVDDFMLLVGHCMWGPGQLQAELDEGQTWEMAAMDTKAVLRFLPRQHRALRRRRCLSRGFPLWRRLYRRIGKLVEGNDIAREHVERLSDAELLRFVQDLSQSQDVERSDATDASALEGNEQVQWQDTVRKVLYLMQQDLSASQQENCCEALRNLIVDQDSRSFATDLGAIESVLAAMKAHSDAAGVQGHCAGTLTHLAAGLRERELIFNLNGLDVVVSGMQQHEDASLVQYKGGAVLANLAADEESQVTVAQSGAIPRILRGMERHLNEQLVQDYCIGALFNLSRAPQNMVNLVLSGGERVVRAALQIHPDAPTVKKVGQVLAEMLEAAKRL